MLAALSHGPLLSPQLRSVLPAALQPPPMGSGGSKGLLQSWLSTVPGVHVDWIESERNHPFNALYQLGVPGEYPCPPPVRRV